MPKIQIELKENLVNFTRLTKIEFLVTMVSNSARATRMIHHFSCLDKKNKEAIKMLNSMCILSCDVYVCACPYVKQ